MTDGELRKKLEDTLEEHFGITESGYGVDELDPCLDSLMQIIKENSPIKERVPLSAEGSSISSTDSSIPDDAEELERQITALYKETYHAAVIFPGFLDALLRLIHQQRLRWEGSARTSELNMFMDVNAHTVTDTQGTYIARRYQQLHDELLVAIKQNFPQGEVANKVNKTDASVDISKADVNKADDAGELIRKELQFAYYQGLDKKGYSQYQEDASVEKIKASLAADDGKEEK